MKKVFMVGTFTGECFFPNTSHFPKKVFESLEDANRAFEEIYAKNAEFGDHTFLVEFNSVEK